ncbi:MerR family transcriptional regulator [Streptomyces sp. L7]
MAHRLGVAPTTLRSWEQRCGIGPAVRAEGRHRRWTPRDVAVLEEMCRLTSSGVPRPSRPRGQAGGRCAPGAPGSEPRPLAGRPAPCRSAMSDGDAGASRRAAVRLDAPAVERQLADAVDRYGVVVAWQEVMVPTLHAVGRRWASSGDRYVEVEHLLSWQVSTVLRRHTPAPGRQTDAPPVVLACVPGEQHTLPIEALNAALGQLSVPTRMFGAAVPCRGTHCGVVRRLGPAAVSPVGAGERSTARVRRWPGTSPTSAGA